jgi:hypothetical protein
MDIFPAPLEMMINMEALTFLEIAFENLCPSINFSQLIEACPATLTDLTIGNAKLTFNESTSKITSIQYLKLKDVDI